jgi:hypothetical protein
MNCGTPRCYPEATGRKPADPDMTAPFSRRHDSAAFLFSESATVTSPFASPAGIVPSESASIPARTVLEHDAGCPSTYERDCAFSPRQNSHVD